MEKELRALTEPEMAEENTRRFNELPADIRLKAIGKIRSIIPLQQAIEIRKDYAEYGALWFVHAGHFTWGMGVRNYLRENVCLDDQLPTNNWDDYYVPLIEAAVGLRERKNKDQFKSCECGCCHAVDYGACDDFEAGANGRCVYCDHGQDCHPGTGTQHNGPLGPIKRKLN